MKIGITGTRFGLTEAQFTSLADVAPQISEMKEFHHGDCVGADAEVATFIKEEQPEVKIVRRPCTITKLCANTDADESYEPIDALERNRLIVDNVDLMLCFPGKMKEEQRSGTWYTIRYTRKKSVPMMIFWPDGTVTSD